MYKLFVYQRDELNNPVVEREIIGHGCRTEQDRTNYSEMLNSYGVKHRWEAV